MKATIPKNWKPGNPEAIAKWMEKLPPVYNFDEVIDNDREYYSR